MIEYFGRALQKLATLFYVDDRLLASQRLARLQEALDVLEGIFGIVVLRTNMDNTVGMVCHPCRSTVIQLD